jgi:hypothetical protein
MKFCLDIRQPESLQVFRLDDAFAAAEFDYNVSGNKGQNSKKKQKKISAASVPSPHAASGALCRASICSQTVRVHTGLANNRMSFASSHQVLGFPGVSSYVLRQSAAWCVAASMTGRCG